MESQKRKQNYPEKFLFGTVDKVNPNDFRQVLLKRSTGQQQQQFIQQSTREKKVEKEARRMKKNSLSAD